MQVSVENVSTLGRRLTVQVPSTEINMIVKERMSELSQKAKVPGFRTGKIPNNVLEQKFGNQVRQEAVGKLIETSLPQALQQEDLKPASRPVVESINNEENNNLEYIVVFEIFPEVILADYSKIAVEKLKAEIAEADIDKALEKLKIQFADWVVCERAAKMGDKLIVDYTSTMNGKPYENNSGKDVQVEIGSQLFIEGFEEGLIGSKQGDERILDLKFPADWRIEKLAGKPVQFFVNVKAVTERSEPKLDENFAKKIGATGDDISAIRNKIRESIEKRVAELSHSRLKDSITTALLKLNPFPLPRALVDREVNVLHEEHHRRMGDKADAACEHHGLVEQAEKRVALGLILNEVIKLEHLTPDQEQVKLRINALAKMFGNEQMLENMYYESEELLSGVRHTVLLDQALDLVVSRASVKEKNVTVDELFNS